MLFKLTLTTPDGEVLSCLTVGEEEDCDDSQVENLNYEPPYDFDVMDANGIIHDLLISISQYKKRIK